LLNLSLDNIDILTSDTCLLVGVYPHYEGSNKLNFKIKLKYLKVDFKVIFICYLLNLIVSTVNMTSNINIKVLIAGFVWSIRLLEDSLSVFYFLALLILLLLTGLVRPCFILSFFAPCKWYYYTVPLLSKKLKLLSYFLFYEIFIGVLFILRTLCR